MSDCRPNLSRSPRLLSPKYFEQPAKLLPPSVFRQAIAGSAGVNVDSDSVVAESNHGGALAKELEKATDPTTPRSDQTKPSTHKRPSHLLSKRIKLRSPEKSEWVPTVEGKSGEVQNTTTFNPKYDNQLLLAAENVPYTLAAKQRWKKSVVVSGGKLDKVNKVLHYTIPADARPPEALDTPTSCINRTSSVVPSSELESKIRSDITPSISVGKSPVESTLSRSSDLPNDLGVINSLPTAVSASCISLVSAFGGRDFLTTDSPPFSSPPVSSVQTVAIGGVNTCRNNLDKVRGFTSKPHTIDNLKLDPERKLPTDLDTSSHIKLCGTGHSEVSPLTNPKCEASLPLVNSVGETIKSSDSTMAGAVDTQSDCILAHVLQNEEFSCAGGTSSEYTPNGEVKAKPKGPTLDCSSDFEIARRLQQDLDAEIAHSIQSQEDQHHDPGPRPGLGRRLGKW